MRLVIVIHKMPAPEFRLLHQVKVVKLERRGTIKYLADLSSRNKNY